MKAVKKKIRFDKIRVRHFIRILAVVAVVFIGGGVILYWFAGNRAEQLMVERVKNRNQILARSGALSISQFLEARKAELLLLAEVEAVKAGREEEGRQVIRKLVDQLKDQPLASIVRVDKEGKSQWSDNPQHKKVAEGVDLADRDYFIWAKEQKAPGEVFISQPITARGGTREGEWIVVVVAPVFYQDKFNGLVFISSPLEDLTKEYITPLISSRTEAFIIAQDGTFVASTLSEMTGQNVLAYPKEQDEWQGKEECLHKAKEALVGQEGAMVHSTRFFEPYKKEHKPVKLITAFSPIKINGTNWSLWISVPYEEAIELVSPLRIDQVVRLVFDLIGLVALILTLVFGVRIVQRDAFVDGFRDGRNGIKKKG